MNTAEEQKAIQLLAEGMPQEDIAKELGVSQSTISRLAKRKQEAIQKEAERLVDMLPDIIEQMARDIKTSNELSKALAEPLPEISAIKVKMLDMEEAWLIDGHELAALYRTPEYIELQYKLRRIEEGHFANVPAMLSNEKLLNKFLELSYKKQADVLRAVGVLPAASQSIFIQNIFQAGSKAIINPQVMQILGDHIRKSILDSNSTIEGEVVAAEIMEEKE